MTAEEHVEACRDSAQQLADDLKAAGDAGVPPIMLIPTLIGVFREAGMMPEGFTIPNLG